MDSLHLWNGPATAEAAKQWTENHLAEAQKNIAALLAVSEKRTVANTLAPFDQAQWHLRIAGSQTGVMFMVHPASEVRDAVQELSQAVSVEGVALSLNQDVYRALQAVDAAGEDAATQYYLERTLLSYRLAGVDRDETTRDKVRELAERMTELSMSFSRAVQDDVRQVRAKREELSGLPEDYIARKPVNDGVVTITTDPPDMTPVMNYARSRELRRRMYLAYNDRAYPKNKQTLLDLLALREEMAKLLGFRSWADLATVDQMMGSAANMRKFLGEVEEAANEAAHREFSELTAFVAEHDASALPLSLSDARFWEEEFRRARYDFDSQSVRPYFPFAQVEKGIREIAEQLFQLRFEPAKDAPVWDAAVQAFDVMDNDGSSAAKGNVIGRIYLDMHPREGKSKWFSECSLIGGVLGRQVPEASLVCNFPQPKSDPEHPEKDDPGLMQYSDVVTYFHEFGHLMHEVLGGQQRWSGQSGIATEGDFVEVPSQMLEEFFENADMLRSFARHHETGEPIPYQTVERMTRAARHGRALSTLTQVMYATYSMETHDRAAGELDLDALLREGYDRFSKYEFVDGNRMYAAFTHLVGYTSNYYTYLFDKAIALEFFAAFREAKDCSEALFDVATAQRYRQQVLAPGGSKPARQLVRDFLGRDTDTSALCEWVQKAIR